MSVFKRLLLASLLGSFVLGITGCTSSDTDENSIPWSRPQNWEGNVPGMGSTPGSNR